MFNADRFKEIVLHVAESSRDDPHFGATKLNKILCFSDFNAYLDLGDPITGADYMRLENGPAPREWMWVSREMVANGDIEIEKRERGSYVQKRVVALREPNLDLFSKEEIEIVDEVVKGMSSATATRVSAWSHQVLVGWQLAADRESIPYESAYLKPPSLSPEVERLVLTYAIDNGFLAA